MYLQQEIWLILVGLIVAGVVKNAHGGSAAFKRLAVYACGASLVTGWFGMLVKGFLPQLAFFPSDVRGVVFIALAAFLAAKWSLRKSTVKLVKKPAAKSANRKN